MSNIELKENKDYIDSFRDFIRKRILVFKFIIKWLLICITIGFLIGSASALFLITLDWATNYRESNFKVVVFLPLAGLFIGLMYHYFGKNVEGGNNTLLDTIHSPKETISPLMAPFVYAGTIITHFFGGSAGREGTAIQMAGSIADQFSKPFRLNTEERKVLIIAAIAGGFGSVFGTPLAGAIFGLEIFLIGRIRYNAIFPAFLTSIIADWVAHLWNVPHTHYTINLIPEISFLHLVYAVIAGAAFGLCAAIYSHTQHKLTDVFKRFIAYPPLRPFVGGAIILFLIWATNTTKYIGLGIPTIVESFEAQLPYYDFLAKMLFTIITLSAGFKGGEATPLFFIGAALGNALAFVLPLPVGLLAGMGFVAVFAGATNTPIACTIMALELFGVECAVYVAIACIVSYLFSGHSSIFKSQVIGEIKHVRLDEDRDKMIGDI